MRGRSIVFEDIHKEEISEGTDGGNSVMLEKVQACYTWEVEKHGNLAHGREKPEESERAFLCQICIGYLPRQFIITFWESQCEIGL